MIVSFCIISHRYCYGFKPSLISIFLVLQTFESKHLTKVKNDQYENHLYLNVLKTFYVDLKTHK